MKGRKILSILLICLFLTALFPSAVSASTISIGITVSRIGYSTLYAHPGELNPYEIDSIKVDGVPYIKASDVSARLGASLTYYSDNISMIINGQETRAFKNSTYFETCITYYGVYLTPSTTKDYQFFAYGYAPGYAALLYNSEWYIALKVINSLGVLMIYENSSTDYEIYDFRANNASPNDPNSYIVGGPWLSSGYCFELYSTFPGYATWANMSSHHLARNFTIGELRDKSTSGNNPNYYTQMRIAVDLLSSAQQVRYVHNNNSSMTISTAFRSWYYNKSIGGASRSFHERGRAFDAPLDSLYTDVYYEFKGSYATPLDIDSSAFTINFWRRRVTTPIGDEIEPMEAESNKWLHMQLDPSAQTGIAPEYP